MTVHMLSADTVIGGIREREWREAYHGNNRREKTRRPTALRAGRQDILGESRRELWVWNPQGT